MALIVETGAGLSNAESVVSVVEIRAFATSRGKTLPAADGDVEVLARRAHDYLLSLEPKFQGYRRLEDQALPFPRQNLVLNGYLLADGSIPTILKNAMCLL